MSKYKNSNIKVFITQDSIFESSNSINMLIFNLRRYIMNKSLDKGDIQFVFQTDVLSLIKKDTKKDRLKECISIIDPTIIVHTTRTDILDLIHICSERTRNIYIINIIEYIKDGIELPKKTYDNVKMIQIIHGKLYGPCDTFFKKNDNNIITNLISEYYQNCNFENKKEVKVCRTDTTYMYMYVIDLVKIVYLMIMRIVHDKLECDDIYYIKTQEISKDYIKRKIDNCSTSEECSKVDMVITNRDIGHDASRFKNQFPTFKFTGIDFGLLETRMYIDRDLEKSAPIFVNSINEYYFTAKKRF
jgi:hypothetical protein